MEVVVVVAAVAAVVAAVALLLHVCRVSPHLARRRILRGGLVGPTPSFPFGNLKEISASASSTTSLDAGAVCSKVYPHFARWRESYGKVFVYWLGTEPFLYVGEPEFLRQATAGKLDRCWGKPDVFKHDRKAMFGKGLIMVEGHHWTYHRNIVAPAFSAANLNGMIGKMVESTNKMIGDWHDRTCSGNRKIKVEEDISRNAAEIIAKISFGIGDDKAKKVYEKLLELQNTLFSGKRLVGVPMGGLLHLKRKLKAAALGKEIDSLLLSTINSRRSSSSSKEKNQQHDLLGLLLAANEDSAPSERKLTARELVDECKTFFFGGHETTGLALTWTLLLLARHPEWQRALRDEVVEALAGGPLHSDGLAKLTKMEWVLNEVLRLYPPAPNSQRQAREDVKVGEVTIPKGTNMWVDTLGMHHDSSLWGDDVEEFRPERFGDRSGGNVGGCKHRMGYLPFGFGGRICIGRNLTRLEYKVVLSLVLREFSIALSPDYQHSPEWLLSLRPGHGVPLLLQSVDKEK